MNVQETALPGVLLLEPEAFEDDRGYFFESFRAARYTAAGIAGPFVQDNVSYSTGGVLRGLHLQWPKAQGKLVFVLAGEILDVAVDLRVDAPTFRRWEARVLSAENRHQIWIPPGFAHGFLVTGREALVAYKCTEVYDRACELAIRWDDPELRVVWPERSPVLSPKDATAPLLRDIPAERLPRC